jgi:glycosyltransferase involved in cell wall biosynthesis
VVPELVPPDCAVPVGDAEALAEAVLCLLEDDARRRELGQMQYEIVQRRFTLDCTVERLAGLYGQVLDMSIK